MKKVTFTFFLCFNTLSKIVQLRLKPEILWYIRVLKVLKISISPNMNIATMHTLSRDTQPQTDKACIVTWYITTTISNDQDWLMISSTVNLLIFAVKQYSVFKISPSQYYSNIFSDGLISATNKTVESGVKHHNP
jgi:hypothetical protein